MGPTEQRYKAGISAQFQLPLARWKQGADCGMAQYAGHTPQL